MHLVFTVKEQVDDTAHPVARSGVEMPDDGEACSKSLQRGFQAFCEHLNGKAFSASLTVHQRCCCCG